jgi:hypothetical protein
MAPWRLAHVDANDVDPALRDELYKPSRRRRTDGHPTRSCGVGCIDALDVAAGPFGPPRVGTGAPVRQGIGETPMARTR